MLFPAEMLHRCRFPDFVVPDFIAVQDAGGSLDATRQIACAAPSPGFTRMLATFGGDPTWIIYPDIPGAHLVGVGIDDLLAKDFGVPADFIRKLF